MRFRNAFSICLVIGCMSAAAFAQGRGRGGAGATNGFYRFNYGAEEMQPISYPERPIRISRRSLSVR